MFRTVLSIVFLSILLAACAAPSAYQTEIDNWRSRHEADLLLDVVWLTLAGLYWLKDGINTIGQGDGFDVELTQNFKGGKFGEIEFHDGKAVLTVERGVDALADGMQIKAIELRSDDPGWRPR